MAKILSMSDIVAASDLATVDVEVQEWGGSVRMRILTGDQFVRFIEDSKGLSKMEQSMKLIAMSIVDENDQPMFTNDSLEVIRKKNMQVILRLQTEALKLNGMETKEEGKEGSPATDKVKND